MSKDKQEPVTALATTRRQFTGLICGTGLLALPGCGGGGSSSAEVPPVTPAAPQITLQPQSVGVTVGQSVTFEVQASGSNLLYQWLRGGVAIAGATASTLVLVTQASDSEARFSVRVSNEGGTVTSAEAVLTLTVLLVAPQITLQPQSVSATVGQSVTLQVQASGANLVYQWLRGGVAIAGATASTFVLATQASDSEARFSVRVSNEAGTVTSAEAVLTLAALPVAPQITTSPQSVTVVLGQSVSLQVVASGSNLAYQWLRGGVAIVGANASTLALIVQATDHLARFSVQVSNEAGSVVSAEAVLTLTQSISLLAGQIEGTGPAQDGVGQLAAFGSIGGICSDRSGNLYVIDKSNSTLRKVTPSGVVTTLFPNFPSDSAVAIDAVGYVYGVRNRTIVKIAPDGSQRVLAGQPGVLGYADGPGDQATFARPNALAFDPQGNLLVGDAPETVMYDGTINVFFIDVVYGGTLRRITPAGVVSTVAGRIGLTLKSTALFDLDNFLCPSSVDRTRELLRPNAITCDSIGNIYVADSVTNNIKKFDLAGGITVLATGGQNVSGTGEMFGVVLTESGEIFYKDVDTLTHFPVVKRRLPNGQVLTYAGGDGVQIKLGPLPGAFGSWGRNPGLVAGPGNSLLCSDANAVLRIGLP